MQYVILLRGINVGGRNKVGVADLTAALEAGGFTDVKTYINSGNVVLTSLATSAEVNNAVEKLIKDAFGFAVDVLTLTGAAYQQITAALPANWIHGKAMGCNVMFLWADADSPDIVDKLPAKPGIDTLIYVPGAVLWAFDGKDVNRTGISKLAGPGPSQRMTIRNCNTVRKIAALLDASAHR
ncbi:DUF1697 domain-containing protein [Kribbella sp. NPDC051587]|uniref:DUF1697 domain-containing protein n=1 Tax=Kribbella sp. NPDC051587 TaxID=3364119 RepID=UPI00378BACDD